MSLKIKGNFKILLNMCNNTPPPHPIFEKPRRTLPHPFFLAKHLLPAYKNPISFYHPQIARRESHRMLNKTERKRLISETKAEIAQALQLPPRREVQYTDDLGIHICERMAAGELLVNICQEPNMPSVVQVHGWLTDPDLGLFYRSYVEARKIQAAVYAEQTLDIADDARNDFMEKKLRDGSTTLALNTENIARSRLRIDTRKWFAACMSPIFRNIASPSNRNGDNTDADPTRAEPSYDFSRLSAPEREQLTFLLGKCRVMPQLVRYDASSPSDTTRELEADYTTVEDDDDE